MIGLAGLKDGAHSLTHPSGPLFVIVRRRGVMAASLFTRPGDFRYVWHAGRQPVADSILAGYRALAERVVMPAD